MLTNSTKFGYTELMPQRAATGQSKFVSDLVFGKQVRVVQMDIERLVITTIFCNSE